SDLLVLADPAANVEAIRTNDRTLEPEQAGELLRHSLESGRERDWWFRGNHLYEVWIQPIYFGQVSQDTMLGFLAVGREVNERTAQELAGVASSEVAFQFGDAQLVSTLPPAQKEQLAQLLPRRISASAQDAEEVQLGSERYLLTSVPISSGGQPIF